VYEGGILVSNVDLVSPALGDLTFFEYVVLAEVAVSADAPSIRVSLSSEDRLLSDVVGSELEEASILVLLEVFPPLFHHSDGGVLCVGDVLIGAGFLPHVVCLLEIASSFLRDLLFALLRFIFNLQPLFPGFLIRLWLQGGFHELFTAGERRKFVSLCYRGSPLYVHLLLDSLINRIYCAEAVSGLC
jgi:hypothetical protein